jgi:hypothetical protein
VAIAEAKDMAQKRKASGKPTPKPSDDRVVVTVLKGSPEYKAWLAGLSEATLIPMASIIRDAVRRWADERKLPGGPDR